MKLRSQETLHLLYLIAPTLMPFFSYLGLYPYFEKQQLLWVTLFTTSAALLLTANIFKRLKKSMRYAHLQHLRAKMELFKNSMPTTQEVEMLKQEYELQEHLIEHKEKRLAEALCTVSEQRAILEKKQQMIWALEKRVHGLMQEIRNLLQIDRLQDELPHTAPKSKSSPFVGSELQHYIKKIETLSGIEHLPVQGKGARFLDLVSDGLAVEMRRLHDIFKDEAHSPFFIYAPNEKKFLFASLGIKNFSGWSAERFKQEFSKCVHQGYLEWESSIQKLRPLKEISIPLQLEHREGFVFSCHCNLGMITKGCFARQILGLFTQNNG